MCNLFLGMCIVGLVQISPETYIMQTYDKVAQIIRTYEVLVSP